MNKAKVEALRELCVRVEAMGWFVKSVEERRRDVWTVSVSRDGFVGFWQVRAVKGFGWSGVRFVQVDSSFSRVSKFNGVEYLKPVSESVANKGLGY